MTKSELKSMTVAELKALARKKKVALESSAKKTDIIDALAAAFKAVKTGIRKAAASVKKATEAKAAPKKAAAAARDVRKNEEKKQAAPKKSPARPAAKKTAAAKATGLVRKSPAVPAAAGLVRSKATPVLEWKLPATDEEPLIAFERIAKSKFYTGPDRHASSDLIGDLPQTYGKERIVLMTRDPFVVYAYWEVVPERLEQEKAWLGWDSTLCIRIYDITGVQFDGTNAVAYFDQEVSAWSGNWYFDLGRPGHSFCADIGLLSPTGKFLTLSRSNFVTMPREGVSDVIDEAWTLGDEEFWSLYGYESFRSGATSPGMHAIVKRRRKGEVGRGVRGRTVTSPGIFSPGMQKVKRK